MTVLPNSRAAYWIEILLVFTATLIVRIANLQHDPINDELYHVLAAESWASNHSLSIGDGAYTRGALYTILLSHWMDIFGHSVDSARWMSTTIGSIWVAAIYGWTKLFLGRKTALVTAFLMCSAPGAIFISQYIRFYALHGLAFFIGAISTYSAISNTAISSRRLTYGVIAVLSFAISLHLQLTTVVGVSGVGAWIILAFLPQISSRLKANRTLRLSIIIIITAGLIATGTLFYLGALDKLIALYTSPMLWGGNSGPLYYHWFLVSQYPILWGLLPLSVLIAITRNNSPAIFCSLVFLAGIFFHSFAGIKGERYIYYIMPFFFILGSTLVVDLFDQASRAISDYSRKTPYLNDRPKITLLAKYTIITIAGAMLVISTPAIRMTTHLVEGNTEHKANDQERYWARHHSNWQQATDIITPLITNNSVVVTTQELHLKYYIGRADITLNKSKLYDISRNLEAAIDPRTGLLVIASEKDFRLLTQCRPHGIVIIHSSAWNNSSLIDHELSKSILQYTTELNTPESIGLRIFTWTNKTDFYNTPLCQKFHSLKNDSGES